MKFELDAQQEAQFLTWAKSLPKERATAIGGRFAFRFVPSSTGTFVSVEDCVSGKRLHILGNL